MSEVTGVSGGRVGERRGEGGGVAETGTFPFGACRYFSFRKGDKAVDDSPCVLGGGLLHRLALIGSGSGLDRKGFLFRSP